jgi:chemotaxis signal transduction protein
VPPAIFRGLSADFLLGMTRREERLVVVLDFARIFSTNERLVLEKVRDGENTIA